MTHGQTTSRLPSPSSDSGRRSRGSSPLGFSWNLEDRVNGATLDLSPDEQAAAAVAQNLLDYMQREDEEDEGAVGSDDEEVERSDMSGEESADEDLADQAPGLSDREEDTGEFDAGGGRKRMRVKDPEQLSRDWFPWEDRITCTLDVLMHLPRSVFSQNQLDLFLWLLRVNKVNDVPSVASMLKLNAALQRICGIETIGYDGALGHKYFVNNLAQIIAQEMANPKVRPHLSFYPEDSGAKLSEARQADRWLRELPSELTTPVARIDGHDYFILEPAMLQSGDCCMPIRWFTRLDPSSKKQVMYARCLRMSVVNSDNATASWRVIDDGGVVHSEREFLKNFPRLQADATHLYGLPHPSLISGLYDPVTKEMHAWTKTDPAVGNEWRAKSKGYRTYAFPLWMYCDDTSGNVSKKWNKHNSFLFTPAGLPRAEVHKEYNVHFLATSNIAPPLEMLDGIVDQLEDAQKNGIWAWDSVTHEPVLLIPSVLALLGDNPMQSEFACHIGLRGKLFCRACWVKGFDGAEDDDDEPSVPSAASTPLPAAPQAQKAKAPKQKKSRKKKIQETAAELLNRLRAFVKPGKPRKKAETVAELRSTFTTAATVVGKKTALEDCRTATGIKDTYQLHFMESLFASYEHKRGKPAKLAALQKKATELPENTMSPVWRINGLDPHADTPVEVLHVVLLGFVKYFWRDLIQNKLKRKDDMKALLKTRLSSVDVSGLGISPLNGETLVQYAGSLTGRDFRAIAQVAPFVLYDMVSSDCYAAWLSLSKLIPLVWQPEIENIHTYLPLLHLEIQQFLLCTARWTSQWFNKPKFHIIVHLPEHIRRFGPAILFATEAFESFNAVIRAKSVHSNRHAPSRDIALAFAQGNRIRHLIAGGYFNTRDQTSIPATSPEHANATHERLHHSKTSSHPTPPMLLPVANEWHQFGPGPASLVAQPSTITRYLGLEYDASSRRETLTGKRMPSVIHKASDLYKTCSDYVLENGDNCSIDQFVIVRAPSGLTTFLAAVREIIQLAGSVEDYSQTPSGILLEVMKLNTSTPTYGMPAVAPHEQPHFVFVHPKALLCTVNVQHRCATHKCQATGTHFVFEEGDKSRPKRAARVHHASSPQDVVLNTAQMRDAVHLQPYRINSNIGPEEDVLTASSLAEVDKRKAAALEAATSASSTTPPAGRGGTGHGRRGRAAPSQTTGQPRRLAEIRQG
ncbi:hypothetical protein BD626DRAFT_448805 [Schizophyllum amplum]|uniref:Uncharacterized protein n=1 Tax=Schizophyllum amplum TaxID=97359 RepID=A0A550CZU6_9AGAR|nr:hypothetical protein BD626DRAFT_448805 [Auriculariopsis ampla]